MIGDELEQIAHGFMPWVLIIALTTINLAACILAALFA